MRLKEPALILMAAVLFWGTAQAEKLRCPDQNTLTRGARTALVGAQKFISAKRISEAKSALEHFLRECPDETHAYITFLLADLSLQQGKTEEAQAGYEETLALCPDYAPAWQNLAKLCYDLGQFTRAGKAFDRAWELTGRMRHDLRFYAAAAYAAGKMPQEALALAQFLCSGKAGPPKPDWVKLMVQLSLESKGDKKKGTEAVTILERLLSESSPEPYLFRLAASLYLNRHDYDQAARTLAAYGLLNPLTYKETTLLADLYNTLGIPGKAAEHYEKALAMNPSQKLFEQLATARFESRDLQAGLEDSDRGLAAYPDSRALWKVRGWILYEKKDFNGASRAFQTAHSLNPKDTRSLYMHGLCACRAGHVESAKKALEQAAVHTEYRARAQGLIRQMGKENG